MQPVWRSERKGLYKDERQDKRWRLRGKEELGERDREKPETVQGTWTKMLVAGGEAEVISSQNLPFSSSCSHLAVCLR